MDDNVIFHMILLSCFFVFVFVNFYKTTLKSLIQEPPQVQASTLKQRSEANHNLF